MEEKRFPKRKSNSIIDHLRIKWISHKIYVNHWGIEEEITMHSQNNIKKAITHKFKEIQWCIKS